MDDEITKLVNEYVAQIETKEEDLVFLKLEIDKILLQSKKEMEDILAELEVKFESGEIAEAEYLSLLRAKKEEKLYQAKDRLDQIARDMEEVSEKREKVLGNDVNRIQSLRKRLHLPD